MGVFSDINKAALILGCGVRHSRRLLIDLPCMQVTASGPAFMGGRATVHKWLTRDVERLAKKLKVKTV